VSRRYKEPDRGLLEQTSILRDVELPEVLGRDTEAARVSYANYPWLVVVTQDCDLLLDRLARSSLSLPGSESPVKKDKILRSILLCPAFPADDVLAGTYVPEAKRWSGVEKKILLDNRDERYHILQQEPPLLQETLALDFKLIVPAHPEYLHSLVRSDPNKMVAVLSSPYRDRLVQRFVGYLGRIAEPDEG
jgi:hypothetical protein